MSQQRAAVVWTYELTNDSIAINKEDGVLSISVFNGSAVTGTVNGSSEIDGNVSAPINIEQDMEYGMVALQDGALDGITITAPAGCTLTLTAQK